MKLSNYNHFIECDNKLYLIFNARNASLLKVNKKIFSLLQKKDINDILGILSSKVLKQLKENEIIIPKDIDEILQIKIEATMKRFANNSISLTIAPTLDCNFECIYCYENHQPIYMTKSIQQKVLSFIELHLNDIKYLDIVWYGGEPLLAKDVVFNLTKEINSLADQYKVNTNFSMITNGYLLTKNIAHKMHTLGIHGVQVTIDGPPDIHNSRRPLKGGNGTFDTIIDNLKKCETLIPNLSIRINVDHNNLSQLPRLEDILNNQGIYGFAKLAYSPVDAISESNKKYESYCLTMQEFSNVNLEYLIEELRKGNYDIFAPPPLGSGCGAIASNSWVIAPDGFLYKCWSDIGYEEKKIGHISNPKKLNNNYYDWLSFDIFKFPECKKCSILPLCMGACPDKLKKLGPGNFCTRWKFYLKEMLILYYLATKRDKGGEKYEYQEN